MEIIQELDKRGRFHCRQIRTRCQNNETTKHSEYDVSCVLRDGRPRDSIYGGVYTRARCQGRGLREKILREKRGGPADKRRTDSPRGTGRSRNARSDDNRPSPTVRSSQPDSRQGWDSKVALWIFSLPCTRDKYARRIFAAFRSSVHRFSPAEPTLRNISAVEFFIHYVNHGSRFT